MSAAIQNRTSERLAALSFIRVTIMIPVLILVGFAILFPIIVQWAVRPNSD